MKKQKCCQNCEHLLSLCFKLQEIQEQELINEERIRWVFAATALLIGIVAGVLIGITA